MEVNMDVEMELDEPEPPAIPPPPPPPPSKEAAVVSVDVDRIWRITYALRQLIGIYVEGQGSHNSFHPLRA